jgi:hypothetical protein
MRFQHGSIRREERKRQSAAWVLRYYATRDSDGKRVERSLVLDSIQELPTENSAWAAVERLRLRDRINRSGFRGVVRVEDIVAHFIQNEPGDQSLSVDPLSHPTVSAYERALKLRILPRWARDWQGPLSPSKSSSGFAR